MEVLNMNIGQRFNKGISNIRTLQKGGAIYFPKKTDSRGRETGKALVVRPVTSKVLNKVGIKQRVQLVNYIAPTNKNRAGPKITPKLYPQLVPNDFVALKQVYKNRAGPKMPTKIKYVIRAKR
jgi:hypothetical protein